MPPRALPVSIGLLIGAAASLLGPPTVRSQQAPIFARPSDGGSGVNLPSGAPDGGPVVDTSARGSLDKEIIRRIIRRNINDVKSCYERLLQRDPWVGGQLLIKFTITATGAVTATSLENSTMLADQDHIVSDCVQGAMKKWQFPKLLNGGSVVITYPFVLTSEFKQIGNGPAPKETVSVAALDGSFFPYRATNADGFPANGLFVRTDAGLLLVDAVWTDAQTEAVLNWGEARFHQPWVVAVITHDHPDRAGGLAALQRRHIPVAALDLTVARLRQRGIKGVSVLLEATAKSRLDPRGFEAFYPGPGHTRDNIVLWFPAPKVLFGGCLIKDQKATDLGFTKDADLASWPEAVRGVAARYPAAREVIPGHGEPLRVDPYAHTLELLARH